MWNICNMQSGQDAAGSRICASWFQVFTRTASMLLIWQRHTLVFYLWPITTSPKYLLALLLQTSHLWASPNLFSLHKTPTRTYPVCQQALSIRAERYKLSPDITGRKLDALCWWSPLHKNGVSWSEIRTCKMGLLNSTVFQIQKELLGLCIWCLRNVGTDNAFQSK